jgi:hypothetical protein
MFPEDWYTRNVYGSKLGPDYLGMLLHISVYIQSIFSVKVSLN